MHFYIEMFRRIEKEYDRNQTEKQIGIIMRGFEIYIQRGTEKQTHRHRTKKKARKEGRVKKERTKSRLIQKGNIIHENDG